MKLLLDLLQTPRPHGRDLSHILTTYFKAWELDAVGNIITIVGANPTTLFSAHIDTADSYTAPLKQKIWINRQTNTVYKTDTMNGCLGADDAVGVFILHEMFKAGIPGLYVIHAGEECGAIGSHHIAARTPTLLDGIQRAIAFDRRGTEDVITHQGGRCCSDTFAKELAQKLGGAFKPSPRGIFTDTAVYTHMVPECTNISSGYFQEHSGHESLELNHVTRLLKTCLTLDWDSLPTERTPARSMDPWGMRYEDPLPRLSALGIETLEDFITRFPDLAWDAIDQGDENDCNITDDYDFEWPELERKQRASRFLSGS